jgi:hypothetical protein
MFGIIGHWRQVGFDASGSVNDIEHNAPLHSILYHRWIGVTTRRQKTRSERLNCRALKFFRCMLFHNPPPDTAVKIKILSPSATGVCETLSQ